MSKRILVPAAFLVSTFALAETASIDQLVQLGIKNSSRLKVYSAQLTQAAAGQKKAKTALAPSFGIVAAGRTLDKAQTASIGPISLTAAKQLQGRLGLEADIDLDISRDSRRRIEYSEISVRAAELRYESATNDLALDIRESIYRIQQSKEFAETAEAAKLNAIDRRSVIAQLFDKGVLTKFDILRAYTEVSDATQKVTIARNRVTIAKANLARLLELKENELPEITGEADHGWAPSQEDTTKLALENRPDLKEAQTGLIASRLGIRLAGTSSRPQATLGLQSTGLYNPGAFEPKGWNTGLALTVRIPLFDRGQARAERSSAEAKVSEAESLVKSLEEAIKFQVIESLALYQDAQERVSVARTAEEQAQEQYRIAEQRFKAGLTQGSLSPLLELSDSQTALTQARNNLTAAEIDLKIAVTRIRYVVGEKVASEVSK